MKSASTRLLAPLLIASILAGCGGGDAAPAASGASVGSGNAPVASTPVTPAAPAAPDPIAPAPSTPSPSAPAQDGTGSATLSWSAPEENEDGSPASASLAGYRVYHGTTPSNLSFAIQLGSPTATQTSLTGLASGTHYFAVTAYSTDGVESDRSPVGSKTVP